jgi:hypothetical protein
MDLNMQDINRWMHLPERADRYSYSVMFVVCIKYIQIKKEIGKFLA